MSPNVVVLTRTDRLGPEGRPLAPSSSSTDPGDAGCVRSAEGRTPSISKYVGDSAATRLDRGCGDARPKSPSSRDVSANHGQTINVHRCLNGRAPNYLLNHVIPVSAIVSRQCLRSAQQNTLVVPRHRLTTYGRRAFSVAGPTAWNGLPVAFRPDNQRCLLPTAFKDSSVRTTASAP